MDHAARPLTKRPRASLACNACRQTKSKCDGNRPTCERCAKNGSGCVYTQGGRDKRMDRQEERRANLALVSRVKELEARLAALSPNGSDNGSSEVQSVGSRSDIVNGDTSRTQIATESSADAIATGLFDQPPAVDIGYFGSSSNHAFFWSLSASIENMTHLAGMRDHEPLTRPAAAVEEQPRNAEQQQQQPPPSLSSSSAAAAAATANKTATPQPESDEFPGLELALQWTRRFFATVGAVLPYVDESAVVQDAERIEAQRQGWLAARPATQALLSIVFAYALHTAQDRSPEPFYRRALRLLDEKAVSMPSTDSLQALLLLASFQQNTQRSMESWAPHYLAVRAAYQLGIHAPASYEYLAPRETQLRARLWCAVVNQDRILTAGLARPCLIPQQHVRMEIADFVYHPQPRQGGLQVDPKLLYFRRLTSLHDIVGTTVDTIYSANVNSSTRLPLTDLLTKTIDLSTKLAQWRDSLDPLSVITANADFGTWLTADFDAERHSLLLSIFHYRTMMLVHGSLLMRVLEQVTGSDASSGVLLDAALSMARNYLRALGEWLRFIDGLLKHQRSFLKCNAVWWTSNYMMLSTCIHVFAFWILSSNLESNHSILGMHGSDIEALLGAGLDTLKLLGGSSIMSRKAHRCLHRYLHFLKGFPSNDTPNENPGAVPASHLETSSQETGIAPAANGMESDVGVDSVTSCIDDVFGGLSQDDLMSSGFFGFDQPISDFDAVGFI